MPEESGDGGTGVYEPFLQGTDGNLGLFMLVFRFDTEACFRWFAVCF
jgi:hypothetical protein